MGSGGAPSLARLLTEKTGMATKRNTILCGVELTGCHAAGTPFWPVILTDPRPVFPSRILWACAFLVLVACGPMAFAQQPPQSGQPQPPMSARESAQVDLTGYWVPLMTEDWLWRAITPAKGDATSVPLNAEGIRVANEWDLANDEASGEQCRPFGAPGLMRLPLRIHVTWEDDDTLAIETDAGQQMRLFNFDNTTQAGRERTWQGHSIAEWTRQVGQFDAAAMFSLSGATGAREEGPPMGSLKVVTQNLRPGYLRKNGLPYSENAVLTEYYSRISTFGNDYMAVLTIVDDPRYLSTNFITSTHFKREADGSKWNPSPCRTDPPRSSAGG